MADIPALVSLAVLKVNWDSTKKSYLDNFIPFIVECLKTTESDVVSVPEIKKILEEMFGIILPHNVLNKLVFRAAKRKFVRKENKVFYKNWDEISKLDFQIVQQKVLTAHESVISRFQRYCQSEHNILWTPEEAEQALLKYFEEEILSLLYIANSKSLIKVNGSSPKNYKFVVASFIRELQVTNDSLFEYLESVFKGNMLANALFIEDQGKVTQNFKKTSIYFDTAFILFALGCTGDSRREPCDELLTLLYETGAELKCFSHTVLEVRGILEGCASDFEKKNLNNELTGLSLESVEHFLLKGKTESDIRMMAVQVEKNIQALGIKIVDTPSYDDHKSVNGEKELEEAISSRISYRNKSSLSRDVKSISAIYRLRGNKLSFSLEESRAIFVTTNHRLVSIVNEFYYQENDSNSIPPIISDMELTNLLWLKKPTKAPNLARKIIISNCYAALRPEDHLWKRYLSEIEKLKKDNTLTNEDFYLLRYTLEAQYALVQITEGENDSFAQGTIPEILEIVKNNVQKGLLEQIELINFQKSESELQVLAAHEAEVKRCENIRRRSNILAKKISLVIEVSFFLILVSVSIYTFPWDIPRIWNEYILSFLFALLLIISVLGMMYGITLKNWINKMERSISGTIENFLQKVSS